MRSASRISAIALGAALVLAVCASVVHADRTTRPAWFNDELVHVIPVPEAEPAIPTQVANPLYVVKGQEVPLVLGGGIPGGPGYSPWWNVILVTGTARDGQFESEEEILAAADSGDVVLVNTGKLLLCPVVPK